MLGPRGLHLLLTIVSVKVYSQHVTSESYSVPSSTFSTDGLVLDSNLRTTELVSTVSTVQNQHLSSLTTTATTSPSPSPLTSQTEHTTSLKDEHTQEHNVKLLDIKATEAMTLLHEISSSTKETPLPSQNSAASSKIMDENIEKNDNAPLEMEEKQNNLLQNDDLLVLRNKPESCKGKEKWLEQPINTDSSSLRKCCPIGESIYYGENGKREFCDSSDKPFDPVIVDVTFYDNCIEDSEQNIELDIEAGNPCNVSFIYSKSNGDALFVLQNGSLLVMDEYGNDSFEIKNDYCLDVDYKTGELFAVVCVASVEPHLGRGQTILFAIFMISSIPCLVLVSFFHFAIRRLRTMHGLCLGFLSSCLAIGFLLHSIAQLSETSKSKLGFAVQYFMLAYFFWLLVLCCNIVIIVWYYLPRYIRLSRNARYTHFISYSFFALSIPLCIVLITRAKGLSGMPSYFFQAWSESIQSSQRYFIPPVTTILIFCFIFLITAYFGFRKLDGLVETRSILRYRALNRTGGKDDTGLPVVDLAMLEETKQDAKCITYLAIIILTTWIMEVITFYSPGNSDYLAFMEIINGLQGVFILIFFIGVRHRRDVIVRWWHDRGSIGITEVEMQNLNTNNA